MLPPTSKTDWFWPQFLCSWWGGVDIWTSLTSHGAAVMWNVKFINVKVSVHALAAQRSCYAVGSSVADVHLLKNVRYGSYDNATRRPQELWLVSTAKCPIDAQCRLLQAEKTAELAKPSQLTVVTTLHHSTWNNINTATAQSSLTFIHKTFQLSLVSQSEWQNKLSNLNLCYWYLWQDSY